MSHYQLRIIAITGCSPEEAADVEGIMRETIMHSTLDWLTAAKFKQVAKQAYDILCYMSTPEGIEHIADVDKALCNSK